MGSLHTMPCHNNRLSFSVALLTSSTSKPQRRVGSSSVSSDVSVVSTSDTPAMCYVMDACCSCRLLMPPQLMPRDTCCFPCWMS